MDQTRYKQAPARPPTPDARRASLQSIALLVLSLALLARLAFCFVVYPHIADQFGPGDGYDVIARNLASGNGYTLPEIDAPAERLPLYPLWLAACFKLFGPAAWSWQVMQSLMGAATCSLVYKLAGRYTSQATAFVAAMFCALHPTLLLFTARPLTETLYVLLTVLFVWAAARRRDAPAGVFAGLAMLVKSTALIHMAVLLTAFLAARAQSALPAPGSRLEAEGTRLASPISRLPSRFAAALMATMLVLTPWAAWNLTNFGTTHLRTATGGRALYHGLYISRQVGWTRPSAEINLDAEVALRHELAERGIAADADVTLRDRIAGSVASDWIAAHRGEALKLWLRNLLLTWYLGRSQLSMLIHALLHAPLLIAATVGAWRIWQNDRESRDLVFLCTSLILAYTLIHAVVQPAVRYILPVVPLAVLLAAGCLRKSDGHKDLLRPTS